MRPKEPHVTNQRIFFDGSYLVNKSGIGRDSRNLLIAAQFAFGKKIEIIYPAFRPFSRRAKLAPQPSHSVTQRILKLQSALLGRANYLDLPQGSILIQSHINSIVPNPNRNIKSIIRLHDLFPITNPEWFRFFSRRLFQIGLSKTINGAFFICDSVTTRNRLIAESSGCEFRSCVSLCPVEIFESNQCGYCEGCRQIKSNKAHVIAVGTLEPRKNYEELLGGWQSSRASMHGINLYIVGGSGWKSKKLQKILTGEKYQNVKWVKGACDGSLGVLIKTAKFLVSTSKAEGFNLPIAESLLLDTPVLISNNEVHKEIYAAFARFYELGSVADLSEQLGLAITNPSFFNGLNNSAKTAFNYQSLLGKLCSSLTEVVNSLSV